MISMNSTEMNHEITIRSTRALWFGRGTWRAPPAGSGNPSCKGKIGSGARCAI